MRQMLLQNVTAILLQNALGFYYKMRQFYYKMQQLSQIVTILLQNATVITKCDVYYKLRQYNKQSKIVCIHEIIRLIIMKIKMEMKNRLHRNDINRPRSRNKHKYSKYKNCLSMMMLTCTRQQLSNIRS